MRHEDGRPPSGTTCRTSVTTFQRIRGLLAPYRKRLLLAFALSSAACLLNLPIPLLVQSLVDHVSLGDVAWLPLCALTLLAVFAAQAGVGLGNTRLVGRVGLDVVR